MQWVETTGRTVEEAKEAALDELGVDEVEAEFEVVAEPRPGLFGRLRAEARVRARVRPTAPRAKDDRRDRRRRGAATSSPSDAGTEQTNGDSAAGDGTGVGEPAESGTASGTGTGTAKSQDRSGSRRSRAGAGQAANAPGSSDDRRAGLDNDREDRDEGAAGVEVDLETQGQIAEEFVTQLIAELGVSGSVALIRVDEETVEVQLTGSDLGLLIGPKGATLIAIQNLVRNVVHHRTGANNGHINVDVGGYRQKRTEALVNFAKQVASTVQQSGTRTAMEPMSSLDRKVVHDTISQIDGVSTVSEGEEPRRRVIVLPASVEP